MGAEPAFGGRHAQPLDDLLRRSESINLDDLERMLDPSGAMELDQKLKNIAPIALAIAMSHDGREFLEWLCDLTVRRAVFTVGSNIEQAALYAAHREGQNAVIHFIIKAVREGQEELERAQQKRS